MPILRQDNVPELARDLVDRLHDLIRTRYGKGASLAEIVLDIDHEQDVGTADFDLADHDTAVPSWARRRSVSSVSRSKGSAIVTG